MAYFQSPSSDMIAVDDDDDDILNLFCMLSRPDFDVNKVNDRGSTYRPRRWNACPRWYKGRDGFGRNSIVNKSNVSQKRWGGKPSP